MDIKEIMYIIKTDSARLIALLVVVLAVCTIYYARDKGSGTAREASDTLSVSDREPKDGKQYYATEQTPVHLQPFDPNTADSTLLLSLGLQPWQVRSIYRYRAHGGV
mgnify:FL=1